MEIANETLPKSIEAKEFSALFCRDRHASGTHIVFEWMFRKKRVFAEIGGFLFEKGWSANVHCAKKGGFLLKAIFFCVILNS